MTPALRTLAQCGTDNRSQAPAQGHMQQKLLPPEHVPQPQPCAQTLVRSPWPGPYSAPHRRPRSQRRAAQQPHTPFPIPTCHPLVQNTDTPDTSQPPAPDHMHALKHVCARLLDGDPALADTAQSPPAGSS